MLLALLPAAHAFCGTYVGEAGANLYNHSSEVVLVREGNVTTLTLVNDYSGDLTNFALLIPVPQVLDESDVTTVDAERVTDLDRYSGPRLVSYTCADASQATAMSCGGEAPTSHGVLNRDEEDVDKSVTVEASFTAGEYGIVVLSSTQSGALLSWLDSNGYAVSPNAEALLQEYIDAGSYFLAARVSLEQLPPDNSFLSPLRIRYRSNVLSLPIRLGTLNSDGVQDFTIYGLNDYTNGELAVSNYPEIALEDDCMLAEGEDADFGATWQAKVDAAFGEDVGWVREYSWMPTSCDPCPEGGALSPETLSAFGYEGDPNTAYFTRLHMRYRPDQITADLQLYASGVVAPDQMRFITYMHELESTYPICGVGMVPAEEAGTCADTTDSATPMSGESASDEATTGGCATSAGPRGWLAAAMAAFFSATLLLRRRAYSSSSRPEE